VNVCVCIYKFTVVNGPTFGAIPASQQPVTMQRYNCERPYTEPSLKAP
jgi:hypothetical protein